MSSGANENSYLPGSQKPWVLPLSGSWEGRELGWSQLLSLVKLFGGLDQPWLKGPTAFPCPLTSRPGWPCSSWGQSAQADSSSPLGAMLMSHRSQPCQGPHSPKLLLPQVETPSLPSLSTSPPEAWPACASRNADHSLLVPTPCVCSESSLPPCLLLWLVSPPPVLPQGLAQLQAYSKCSITVD